MSSRVCAAKHRSAARSGARAALVLALVTLGWMSGACDSADDVSAARAEYNTALADLAAGRYEQAVQGFAQAHARARGDVELRFRATVNLGQAMARQVDMQTDPANLPPESLEKARDLLLSSESWLSAALRIRPDDEELRRDLELVKRHARAIADQLNKGKNSLEARLSRVIDGDRDTGVEGQRHLRDHIRALSMDVQRSGNAAEPVEFQKDFERLATMQRLLAADVNIISDLAGDERSNLEDKGGPDGAGLGDEEKVRAAQLANLEYYLQKARAELAATRRALRRLQVERAHRRSDIALAYLARAREQLVDPMTVLKSVAQDQVLLLTHTSALVALGRGDVRVEGADPGGQQAGPADPIRAPVWLNNDHLGDRQKDAFERTGEVLARFQSIDPAGDPVGQPDAGDAGGAADAPEDPKQKRMLESARQAVPFLERATRAMEASRAALAANERETSAREQREAIIALSAAIERFAEVRELIELTYAEHAQVIAALTPPEQADATDPLAQKMASLGTEERVELIGEGLRRNLERLGRLQGLFDDELATLDAQAAQMAQAAAQNQADPQADPHAQAVEGQRQQYTRAKELGQQASDALGELSALVTQAGNARVPAAARTEQALVVADTGKTHIEELRKLFYSLIEHLQELIAEQTKTFDRTGTAASTIDTDQMLQSLGPALDAQRGHASMGRSLADAVAEQADAAAHGGQDPKQAEQFRQAAEELNKATEEMNLATGRMQEDYDAAQAASPDLSDVMTAQRAAIDHLEAALELLRPPQEQNQDQDQQQQDQQQDQDQDQDQGMNKQQVQRRLQELRDREAERDRKKRQQFKPEPVDKDW